VRDLYCKILFVIATTIVSIPISMEFDRSSEVTPLLSGPTTAEIGELLRVSTGADVVKWMVVPEVSDYQEFDKGSLAICFRMPGNYIIIAATLKGSELALEKHEITVISSNTPKPTPTPTPDESPDETPGVLTLADQIVLWCQEAKVSKDLSAKVGSNFQRVANSKTIKSTQGMVTETASLNKLVPPGSHSEVVGKVQATLLATPPNGLDEYRTLWIEIGSGFLNYSD